MTLKIQTKYLTNFPCIKHIIITEISQVSPHALKGQKLLAQGIALGYYGRKPVALKGQKLSDTRHKNSNGISIPLSKPHCYSCISKR